MGSEMCIRDRWHVVRTIRVADARGAQRAQRAGSDRGRYSRRHPAANAGRGTAAVQGHQARLETVGVANGVTVLDDFAHHPTAVHETLSALRTGYPGRRLWAVFEPRSASSCRRVFQDDFAKAFGAADEIVLAAVFRSTLPEAERLSAEQLVDDLSRQGRHARHIPEIDDIVSTIARERRDGDVVVLMSNGGFGGIHGKLLQALRE